MGRQKYPARSWPSLQAADLSFLLLALTLHTSGKGPGTFELKPKACFFFFVFLFFSGAEKEEEYGVLV